jgi:hypothetical protein
MRLVKNMETINKKSSFKLFKDLGDEGRLNAIKALKLEKPELFEMKRKAGHFESYGISKDIPFTETVVEVIKDAVDMLIEEKINKTKKNKENE